MNWKLNQPTRLRNGSTVLLSIEIQIDGDYKYFPWTVEGFEAASILWMDNTSKIRSNDFENYSIKIVSDSLIDAVEYISKRELGQKDWFFYLALMTGQLQEKVSK